MHPPTQATGHDHLHLVPVEAGTTFDKRNRAQCFLEIFTVNCCSGHNQTKGSS